MVSAGVKRLRHLLDVVWSILLEINRTPDLQIGLAIQVGGFDEADLCSTACGQLCAQMSIMTSGEEQHSKDR